MRALAPLALAFLAGCACTEIGCLDGVSVRLRYPPGHEYTVELIPSSGPAQVVECGGLRRACSLFFENVDADRATIVITYGEDGRIEREVPLHFQPQYPNGRACAAACHVAQVTIDTW